MSALFDTMSDEIFQILKGSGRSLTLYGSDGNRVYDPAQARTVFAEPDKMVVSIKEAGDDSEVKLYLSSTAETSTLAKLINTLRHISTRYNVLFNVRKYGRELSPKDFAFQAEPMSESMNEAMWGTTKTSYQTFGQAKLVVRHCEPVRENVIGGRGRNILALFVETKSGERFKFPAIHLSGARAWAQHLNQGGMPQDRMGNHIIEMAMESSQLGGVNRYINYSRKTLSESALGLRYPIKSRLIELRKALVSYSRPAGYAKALEALTNEPSKMILEGQMMTLETSRIASLLGIDSNHALAESLLPVALLTIGENKMFNNSDGKFQRVIAVEHDSAMAALVEALVSEYGHAEHESWALEEGLLSVSSDILEDVVSYLGETAYQVYEENEDKFLVYAKNWMLKRLKAAGEGEQLSAEQEQAASQLADGLKGILSGKAPGKPVMGDQPRFANPTAEMAFKIGAFLDAKAGVKNDALWTYMSTLVHDLQHGQKLSSTEQMFATKIAQMANVQEGVVDEATFMEVGNDDPDHINYGGDDQAYEDAATEVHNDFEKYYLADFIRGSYPEFATDGTAEDPSSTQDVVGDLTGFLRGVLANDFSIENTDPTDLAKEVFPIVKKYAESHGWTFDHDITEAWGRRTPSFTSTVEIGDEDDIEVKVEYSPNDEDIDIEQVIDKRTGMDIMSQLTRRQLEDLQVLASENEAEEHAAAQDAKYDAYRERFFGVNGDMDEDMAVPSSIEYGDHVATPQGPGQVVDASNDHIVVQFLHGGQEAFPIGDVEKVDVDAEMSKAAPRPRMKEEIELDEWFEQFDPKVVTKNMMDEHAPLATVSRGLTLEDVQAGLSNILDAAMMQKVWAKVQKFAEEIIANPEQYGIETTYAGMDDHDEDKYHAVNKVIALLKDKLADSLSDAAHGHATEGLDEEELNEYGASEFNTKDPVLKQLVKHLNNNWDLTQASSDKMMFNKTVGKKRFKITVMPEAVILDVFSPTDILAHERFGAGGKPIGQLANTMQKFTSVREDYSIDETQYLPDLNEMEFDNGEDDEKVGGDMGDDLFGEVEKDSEKVEESELDYLKRMAGM